MSPGRNSKENSPNNAVSEQYIQQEQPLTPLQHQQNMEGPLTSPSQKKSFFKRNIEDGMDR